MFDHLKALAKKCPSNIILHIGTNNNFNKPGRLILNKIHRLKISSKKPSRYVK